MSHSNLSEVCLACRRPKANVSCGICQEPLCKSCALFLDASSFSFMKKIPEDLSHTYYCPSCHDAQVAPALESYNEVMERAREAYFFFVTQRKPIPIIKKSKEKVFVSSCDDRDETILRLAFLAVEQGYNAVVQAEVDSQKVRNEGYEKSVWKGEGFPAEVDAARLERRK